MILKYLSQRAFSSKSYKNVVFSFDNHPIMNSGARNLTFFEYSCSWQGNDEPEIDWGKS
jgi:hypothetical protein